MIVCGGKVMMAADLMQAMRHALGKPPVKNGPNRFPGICAAARQFGVSRMHLYHVLSGRRVSHRLTRLWVEYRRAS